MFKIIFFESDSCINWIGAYFKEQKFLFFRLFNFVLFKSNELRLFEDNVLSLDNHITKSIKLNYGYNKHVLEYMGKKNIRNYILSEQLLFLESKGFDIQIKKEIDINEVLINLSLSKYQDFIYQTTLATDETDFVCLRKFLTGEVIMSKKKEDYIIDYISNELNFYGIDLSIYDYLIKETGKNKYEVSLENTNTGRKIMIKDILFDQNNKIYSIGINNGLIL